MKTKTKEEKTFKIGEAIVETLDSYHYWENRKDEDLKLFVVLLEKKDYLFQFLLKKN